jgi:2-keto-4-pentenoate hydratase/2-oxohepta-3-ene-1,7-dioic acid hydratase in catechol pathway
MTSYRLLTYQSAEGPRAGIIVGETVHDLASVSKRSDFATVLGVLNDWPAAARLLPELAAVVDGKPATALREAHILAPLLYPSAVYAAGANYRDHAINMARAHNMEPGPDPHQLDLNPWHFMKAPRCVVGTEARVALPSEKLDWEVELAAIIGMPAKNVPEERALDYVAAFTVANDLSARDLFVRRHLPASSPFKYDWICQKNFDGACPMGPWLTPSAEIADPQALAIKLWVNDAIKQDSTTAEMIFTAAEQIAFLSSRITLYPGDVVLTGTPAGAGAERGQFLKSGDNVKAWIEHIGELVTYII